MVFFKLGNTVGYPGTYCNIHREFLEAIPLTANSETPVRLLTKDVEGDDVDEKDVSAPGGDHVEVGQGAEGRPVDVARLHRLGFAEFKPVDP